MFATKSVHLCKNRSKNRPKYLKSDNHHPLLPTKPNLLRIILDYLYK